MFDMVEYGGCMGENTAYDGWNNEWLRWRNAGGQMMETR